MDLRKKPFAEVLQKLSDRGIIACIERTENVYHCVANFEIVARYKTRRSCKRFFTKMANHLYGNNVQGLQD